MDQLWVACLLTCAAVTSAELTSIRMVLKEDSDAVLNCSVSDSIRGQVFDWKKDSNIDVFIYAKGDTYGNGKAIEGQHSQFRHRVVHFPEALDFGNASIKIKKAEVRDTGTYTCEFPLSPVKQRSHISLLVGVCPEPYILKIGETTNRELWQCEVRGAHPEPEVRWQDSSGNVLPAQKTKSEIRDGRFYITVQANMTKTDTYSCVVTQEDICHQVKSSTFVYIGACSEPRIKIVDGKTDQQMLQCDVEGAHPKPAVRWQDSSGNVLDAQETRSEIRDGRFYVTIQAAVTKTDTYSCVVTPEEACRQHNASTLVFIGPATDAAPQSGSNAGVLGGVIAFLAVVIVCLVIAAIIFYCKCWLKKGPGATGGESNRTPNETSTDPKPSDPLKMNC